MNTMLTEFFLVALLIDGMLSLCLAAAFLRIMAERRRRLAVLRKLREARQESDWWKKGYMEIEEKHPA